MKTYKAQRSEKLKAKEAQKKQEKGMVFYNKPSSANNHFGMRAKTAIIEHPGLSQYEGHFGGMGEVPHGEETVPAVFFTSIDTMLEAIKDNGSKVYGTLGRINGIQTLGKRVNGKKLNVNNVVQNAVNYFLEDLTKEEKKLLTQDKTKVILYIDETPIEESIEYKGKEYPVTAHKITGLGVKGSGEEEASTDEGFEEYPEEEAANEGPGSSEDNEVVI